jgi:ankyrin repeat protein
MELDVFEDVDKGTAFDIIVEENKVEMMDFVLKNNLFMLDPKEIDNALIRSAQIDELDMVKCLVENGANIHAKNEYVLKESVSNANYKVVKYLLENGADVSVDDNIVLKMSIENGDDDIVELIRTVATK